MPEPRFTVVVNDEGQYSIWTQGRTLPVGWYDAGFAGTREECLAHVDQVWTDLRPRSLQVALGGQGQSSAGRSSGQRSS